MKKVVCLIIALTVASLCFAEDDKPYTFAGIPWGTTKEDIIKFVAEKTDFKEYSSEYLSIHSDKHYNSLVYESKSSKIAFCFFRDNSKPDTKSPLSSVEIVSRRYSSNDKELSEEDFQKHLNTLIKKYGEPLYLKNATQKTYQKIYLSQMQELYETPFNGLFQNMKIMWIDDEAAIIITEDYSYSWHIIYTCDGAVMNKFFDNILPYSTNKEKQSLDDMF